jgi:hypothetical protein
MMTSQEKFAYIHVQICACERGEVNALVCPYCGELHAKGDPLCCETFAKACAGAIALERIQPGRIQAHPF